MGGAVLGVDKFWGKQGNLLGQPSPAPSDITDGMHGGLKPFMLAARSDMPLGKGR